MKNKLTIIKRYAFLLLAALDAFSRRDPNRIEFQASNNSMTGHFLSINCLFQAWLIVAIRKYKAT